MFYFLSLFAAVYFKQMSWNGWMRGALVTIFLAGVARPSTITLDPFQKADYEATVPFWAAGSSPTTSLDFAIVPLNVDVGLFTMQGQYVPIFPSELTSEGALYSAEVPANPGTDYLLALASVSPNPVSVDLNEALFGANPIDPPLPDPVPEPAAWQLLCAGGGLLLLLRLSRRRGRLLRFS